MENSKKLKFRELTNLGKGDAHAGQRANKARHSVGSIKYRTPTPEVGATHMFTNRWRDK